MENGKRRKTYSYAEISADFVGQHLFSALIAENLDAAPKFEVCQANATAMVNVVHVVLLHVANAKTHKMISCSTPMPTLTSARRFIQF